MTKTRTPERRRSHRRPILDTFSVFIVVPAKGLYKLEILDMSEDGIGFKLDVEGESSSGFPIQLGSSLEIQLYLNPSLYIPLSVEAIQVLEGKDGRRIGTRFHDKKDPAYQAFLSLLHFLDTLVDVLKINQQPVT